MLDLPLLELCNTDSTIKKLQIQETYERENKGTDLPNRFGLMECQVLHNGKTSLEQFLI